MIHRSDNRLRVVDHMLKRHRNRCVVTLHDVAHGVANQQHINTC